jgi:hypothetical protein
VDLALERGAGGSDENGNKARQGLGERYRVSLCPDLDERFIRGLAKDSRWAKSDKDLLFWGRLDEEGPCRFRVGGESIPRRTNCLVRQGGGLVSCCGTRADRRRFCLTIQP